MWAQEGCGGSVGGCEECAIDLQRDFILKLLDFQTLVCSQSALKILRQI